jgi:hypothetical protein
VTYAEDVTIDDVRRIDSFLRARIARLSRAERGSDERQAARAVKGALLLLVGTLEHALPLARAAARNGIVEDSLRLQISMGWNALWSLVSPWQESAEYDHGRWRHVKYWNADHERALHFRGQREN